MNSGLAQSLIATWAFFLQAPAWAAPAAQVMDLISRTYRPDVTSKQEKVGQFLNCSIYSLKVTGQDPLNSQLRDVEVRLYIPSSKVNQQSELKTVLLLPPTGGENGLDRGYADSLCIAGLRVALIERWYGDTLDETDLEMHDRRSLRAQAAIRHVLEHLKPRRPRQVGVLGTSVGAITGAWMMHFDERISAGALIVGGLGMPEIISVSEERGLTRLREERMKEFGFQDTASYAEALRKRIAIEPRDFIGMTGPKKVWTMIALKDVTVPTEFQRALYEANGSQELHTHDSNHLNTIVYTYATYRRAIVQFFKENLK